MYRRSLSCPSCSGKFSGKLLLLKRASYTEKKNNIFIDVCCRNVCTKFSRSEYSVLYIAIYRECNEWMDGRTDGWFYLRVKIFSVKKLIGGGNTIYTLLVFKIKSAFITTEGTEWEISAERAGPANCRVWPAGSVSFPWRVYFNSCDYTAENGFYLGGVNRGM